VATPRKPKRLKQNQNDFSWKFKVNPPQRWNWMSQTCCNWKKGRLILTPTLLMRFDF